LFTVNAGMLGALYYLKVLRSIVQLIPVPVVNALIDLKRASKGLLHYIAVFPNFPAVICSDELIAFMYPTTLPFVIILRSFHRKPIPPALPVKTT
jgi:hypothetical protein